jgi:hypothetical protein
LNFGNAKDSDDFKDWYNPDKKSLPGVLSYAQSKSTKKEDPVAADTKTKTDEKKPAVADKKEAPKA